MNDLLLNIDKIHTTEMGFKRISKNLGVSLCNVIQFCKNKITNPNCFIYRKGKNWYCEVDNIKITIHSTSYSIITARVLKQK